MEALKFFGGLYGCKIPDVENIEVIGKDKVVRCTDVESADEIDGGEPSLPPCKSNLDTLINMMEKNITDGKRMKACSTGHSKEWCNIIGEEEGVKIIDTKNFTNRIKIEDATILQTNQDNLCCFEAGATIKDIQDVLWPEDDRSNINTTNQVLLNQTGCVKLSIAGTIATAAHGNGLKQPIIADMVKSFHLLTVESGQVKQYRLEPNGGITNKEQFKNKFNFEVIQDDEKFYATLVNIGCMGIVYSYILEVKSAFYLKENRYMLPWGDAKEKLRELFDADETLHSFELFVCPYPPIEPKIYKVDQHIQVVICELRICNGPPQGERPDLYFVQPDWISSAFTEACTQNPAIVPFMICLMMNATQCKDVVMNACEALDPLSGLAVSGEVKVSECAMGVEDADDVIKKVECVIELFQGIKKENEHQLVTTPFAVRFSQQSKAYMAMQYDRPSMMIICNILKDTPKADDTLKQFRDCMLTKYNGRPHWGMIQEMDKEKLEKLYDTNRIKTFKNILGTFDPDKFFSNEFTKKVFDHYKL